MEESPKPTYTKRDYLSITALMDFVRCPRRFFYKKSGLVPKEEGSALLYGTAMHAAVPVATIEGFEPAFERFKEVWNEELADDKRCIRRAESQLRHFVHTHSMGRAIYAFEKAPPGTIELEEDTSPFEIPVALDVGLSIPIVARIDGWVRHRDSGELWGWEFKTGSNWPPGAWSKIPENLELHPQILAYTLMLRTLNKDVRGMMTEIMLVDKSKVDNITQPIPVPEHLTANFHVWLRFYGGLLLACEERLLNGDDPASAFPQNFAGCSAYPLYYLPSFNCDYINLCRVEDWRTLTSLYDIVPDHKFVKLTTKGKE